MKKYCLLLAIVFFSLLLMGASLEEWVKERYDIKLLQIGQFHGKEVSAVTGEEYYALFQVNDSCFVRKVQLTAEEVYDGIYEDTSGVAISIDFDQKPIFMIKGLEDIREGAIKTVFTGNKFVYPGESFRIPGFHKAAYLLIGFGNAVDRGDILIRDYEIKLRHKQMNQLLVHIDAVAMEGPPTIIWAGDLDRDNKLDLFMNLNYDYNFDVFALFLSSKSRQGELVKKVAQFITIGC